jgi:excisionase family DNA binding protein
MKSASPLAFGIAEAASVARIGRTTLYGAIKSGELRARKVGKRTLILQEDLLDWLNSRPSARSRDSSMRSKGGINA